MYLRAVLGLAEQFEFITTEHGVKVIAKIEVVLPQNDPLTNQVVFKKTEDMQRFTSPLLFKVFENNIYLVVNQDKRHPIDNYHVRFKLTLKNPPNFLKNKEKTTTALPIPKIDYNDFLDKALALYPYEKNDKELDYSFTD